MINKKNCMLKSDTTSTVCPKILDKIIEASKQPYESGYQEDCYTQKVREIMQGYFSKPVQCYFNASGSGANMLAIKAMKQNYSSIICCDETHINRYEVGGTEYNTGCKIITEPSKNAKLTIDMIKGKLNTRGNYNYPLPTIVVISQATEKGTCYTIDELKQLCDFCHQNNIYVYLDGARLANAMAYLKTSFKEMLEDTGVDIASFGGNKNGAMFGEMIILLNSKFFDNFILNQKQSSQLFSKTRFLSCQFLAFLEGELWCKNAQNANSMARYLAKNLRKLNIKITQKVETNTVFARIENDLKTYINERYLVDSYDHNSSVRLMTSWCTTRAEIDEFVDYIKSFKNLK